MPLGSLITENEEKRVDREAIAELKYRLVLFLRELYSFIGFEYTVLKCWCRSREAVEPEALVSRRPTELECTR